MYLGSSNALGLISDVHGNFAALSAVLGEIDKRGIKEIVCLGDTAGYYPQVNDCIDALRDREVASVMGNHDWYLTSGRCIRSTMANVCIDYQKTKISEGNLMWLTHLPLQLERHGIRMVHGGWSDPLDEYLEPSAEYFKLLRGRFFASGHSHIPQVFTSAEKIWCNPGSVGQPRDGDPRASFAVFDGLNFTIERVEYDVSETIKACVDAGLPKKVFGGLGAGSSTLTEGTP